MTKGVNQMQGHFNPAVGVQGWSFPLFLHPFSVVFIEIVKNADFKAKEEKRWGYAL